MARKVKIKVNSLAVAELLSSDAMLDDLKERAGNIAVAANAESEPGAFEEQWWIAKGSTRLSRAMARVVTANTAGRRAEAEHRILERSLDAGRG